VGERRRQDRGNVVRRQFALPAVVAFSLAWWLLVPLSLGFALRWLFTGHASAIGSVFNPADPSVYLLWLKVGMTSGVAFAIHEMSTREIRSPERSRMRTRVFSRAIILCVAASLSAPFVIQHVEPHATRVPYLAAFALCGALFGIACSVLLAHIRDDEVNEVSAEPI
jgi:hypothetical protein